MFAFSLLRLMLESPSISPTPNPQPLRSHEPEADSFDATSYPTELSKTKTVKLRSQRVVYISILQIASALSSIRHDFSNINSETVYTRGFTLNCKQLAISRRGRNKNPARRAVRGFTLSKDRQRK